jgi:hypothetical protein
MSLNRILKPPKVFVHCPKIHHKISKVVKGSKTFLGPFRPILGSDRPKVAQVVLGERHGKNKLSNFFLEKGMS